MEDLRREQVEALEVLGEYNTKLIQGVTDIIEELQVERKADTQEYMKEIIEGINWEIQVVNGTLSLINEGIERINKDEINECIQKFSTKYETKDDKVIGQSFKEDILPFLRKIEVVTKEVITS